MPDETMFEVGDRVRFVNTHSANPTVTGEVGTIIASYGNGFAVEFDNNIRGHSFSGRTKQFHGWLCSPLDLEAIVEDPVEVQINFSFDDFLNGVEEY